MYLAFSSLHFSMSKRSGIFEHLMGHGLPSMKKGYDSIFLTSGGRITSYGPMGEFNWQVSTFSIFLKRVLQLYFEDIRISVIGPDDTSHENLWYEWVMFMHGSTSTLNPTVPLGQVTTNICYTLFIQGSGISFVYLPFKAVDLNFYSYFFSLCSAQD